MPPGKVEIFLNLAILKLSLYEMPTVENLYTYIQFSFNMYLLKQKSAIFRYLIIFKTNYKPQFTIFLVFVDNLSKSPKFSRITPSLWIKLLQKVSLMFNMRRSFISKSSTQHEGEIASIAFKNISLPNRKIVGIIQDSIS